MELQISGQSTYSLQSQLPKPLQRPQTSTAHDWDICPESLSLGPSLGVGEYGEVYRGRWHGTPVAVKVLKGGAALDEEQLATEAIVQRHIHHPNIIQFLGFSVVRGEVAVVGELMDGGSLADALTRHPQPPLRRALEIALDCARGLSYLHLANPHAIIHRDLKPSNIMLASCRSSAAKTHGDALLDSAVAKIADFGLSKVMHRRPTAGCIHRESTSLPHEAAGDAHDSVPSDGDGESGQTRSEETRSAQSDMEAHLLGGHAGGLEQPSRQDAVMQDIAPGGQQEYRMTGGTGAYVFMAPEIFRHGPYNAKADVYSLAMVMYEMLSGRRPFAGMDPGPAAMRAATDDLRPEWPAEPPPRYTGAERAVLPGVQRVVQRCWAASPALRPACSEIITQLEALISQLDSHPDQSICSKHHSPTKRSSSRVMHTMWAKTSKSFSKFKGNQ